MADQALKAFDEKRYVDSVKLFNVFMKDHPKKTTPDHFLLRSTALLRLGKKEAALRDADRATRLASVQKDAQMLGKAQMRRAVTFVSLGDNASAKKCVDFAEEANPEERTIPVWKAKIGMSAGSGDTADVAKIPDIDISYVWKDANEPKSEVKPDLVPKAAPAPAPVPTATPTPKSNPVPPQTTFQAPTSEFKFESKPDSDLATNLASSVHIPGPKEKLRTDFFQSNEKITVSVYRKNTPQTAKIDIQSTSLSISSAMYTWSVNLYAPIIASESSVQIYGTKVDFTLVKETPGKWPSVGGNAAAAPSTSATKAPVAAPATTSAVPKITIDHFQTPTHINAYLYVPDLANYSASVEATTHNFTVTFTNKTDASKSFVKTVNLHGAIEPELVQEKVYPTKLEIQMRKKTSGNWPALEVGVKSSTNDVVPAKDWSKIQIEDDSDDDLNSENPDDFFKALYADADDDTRRAMMKSFVESGGTSLSTDWDKVERGDH